MPGAEYFLCIDPHGHEAVKGDAAAAYDYAIKHHCTVDELTRRRVLLDGLSPWPVDPMMLWAWSPEAEH